MMLSICSFACLSVCLSIFSKKLSNVSSLYDGLGPVSHTICEMLRRKLGVLLLALIFSYVHTLIAHISRNR